MGVRHVVVGTGGDEELVFAPGSRAPSLALAVREEAEPPLQSAIELGTFPLPRSERGQRAHPIEAEVVAELFEKEVRERRRRFSDGESRMSFPFDLSHGPSAAFRGEREERARESAADDRDVESLRHADRPQEHGFGGRAGAVCVRFMNSIRARRSSKQAPHEENRPRSQRSANTLPAPAVRGMAPATARSRSASVGGTNSPRRASASIAPFPMRVGMIATRARAGLESEHGGADRPLDRLIARNARQPEQHERAKRDLPGSQAIRRAPEVVDRHPLVEGVERFRVNRFEPHRELESAADLFREAMARFADESRVALDDDAIEAIHRERDSGEVLPRERPRIEKAPRVVELRAAGVREFGERRPDLRGDGTARHRSFRRVPPEVAHQASPRALAVRDENRHDRRDAARLRELLLQKDSDGTSGVVRDRPSGAAPLENPSVARRGKPGVRRRVRRFRSREPQSDSGSRTRGTRAACAPELPALRAGSGAWERPAFLFP